MPLLGFDLYWYYRECANMLTGPCKTIGLDRSEHCSLPSRIPFWLVLNQSVSPLGEGGVCWDVSNCIIHMRGASNSLCSGAQCTNSQSSHHFLFRRQSSHYAFSFPIHNFDLSFNEVSDVSQFNPPVRPFL